MLHTDTTVIRLLDGTRAYLHAVIYNFSRRILAWRVADTFAPVNSVTVLLDASRAAASSDTVPVVLSPPCVTIEHGYRSNQARAARTRSPDRLGETLPEFLQDKSPTRLVPV
jgi:hypothetical protein